MTTPPPDRAEHAVPVAVVGMVPAVAKVSLATWHNNLPPLISQVLSSLMLFAFQQLGAGVLITTKSYLVRTVVLGVFFFLLIPLGKLLLIKLGLVSLSPAILSRAGLATGHSDPYDTPYLQTLHGIIETLLWEIYSFAEDVFNPESFDDYLYN